MKIINTLYAGGTRGARVLNFSVSLMWTLGIFLYSLKIIPVDIPPELTESLVYVFALAFVTSVSSLLSLLVQKYREILKYLSLHLGALLNALISAGFAAEYPPLSMTAVSSVLFSIWLLGAAYFAMETCNLNCKNS